MEPTLNGPPVARKPLTWNIVGRDHADIAMISRWPAVVPPDLAWGAATGRGVRVCIMDSGVEGDHPLVGPIQGSWAVQDQPDGSKSVVPVEPGDSSGHGTACASVVRAVAPDCEIHSLRVLGQGLSGSGDALLTGLKWAIAQRYPVVNMSLSTTRQKFVDSLRTLTDEAYFNKTLLVASAHNMPVESFPWRFASVISVGSHEESDPLTFYYNPNPPVEFFGRGLDLDVAWLGGGTLRCTGNSFATPHIAAICALVMAKHPDLTPFQLKSVLSQTAANAQGAA